MSVAEDRAVIMEWVNRFYANSVICLNNLCNGTQNALRKRMADVALLVQSIEDANGILSEQEITNMYGFLQKLINLKVDTTIDN
jgi:hypothetical protein